MGCTCVCCASVRSVRFVSSELYGEVEKIERMLSFAHVNKYFSYEDTSINNF